MRLPEVASVDRIDVTLVLVHEAGDTAERLGLLLRSESVPARLLNGAAFTLRVVPRTGLLGWRGASLLIELTGELASIAVGGCLISWQQFTRFRELATQQGVAYLGLASTDEAGDSVWFSVSPAEIVARSGLARLGERLPLAAWAVAALLAVLVAGAALGWLLASLPGR